MDALPLPARILVCGRNDQLSRHAFHDAVGLTPRRCPGCGGQVHASSLPCNPELRPFEPDCGTCGGAGLNRHAEAA